MNKINKRSVIELLKDQKEIFGDLILERHGSLQKTNLNEKDSSKFNLTDNLIKEDWQTAKSLIELILLYN